MSSIYCDYCGVSNTAEILYNCNECNTNTCDKHNYYKSECKYETLYAPGGSLPPSPFNTPPYPWSDSE